MNTTTFKQFFGLLLVSGGMAFGLTACGDEEETKCADNSECPADKPICNPDTLICEAPAVVEAPCNAQTDVDPDAFCDALNAGSTCTDDADSDTNGCSVVGGGTDCSTGADQAAQDAICVAAGDGNTCVNGVCETVSEGLENRYIRITDTTASCNPDSMAGPDSDRVRDAGADIGIVQLSGASGSIGFADLPAASAYEPGTGTPELNTPAVVFDGTAPDDVSPTTGCREDADGGGRNFTPNVVTSLGCGGSIILGFDTSTGETASISNGNVIEITEYGSFCEGGTGVGTDTYSVSLCETAVNADIATISGDAACNISLATGLAGKTTTTVTGAQL